ncbi:OmpA family protein [Marinobacter algicola]|uniref:Outer membrane protein and related peptidoglycan-associated (Lipo)protein n=1 Tax=Marinobacter algicola DG893 TaxID=443152 RepID=A6F3S0_9GAMM|nr:OmpA family protein [Marinobacter algicola]EDM46626.1 Outer membrane protein and related peptidoglycan-associated (lipo)protein [Marinobacter algicola DG893]
MTVLILDNPDLLARAAIESGLPMPSLASDSTPRKPHRLRFHYGFNKHRLDEQDLAILRQHALYLRHNPGVTVRIHGHADNFGVSEYNHFLSRLRASSAAKVLIREGVRESQVLVSGWGSDRPLARPEDHAANRRLELEYVTMEMARAL